MRRRYTLIVELELRPGAIAPLPEDIESDALHGGLDGLHDGYRGVTITATGPEVAE